MRTVTFVILLWIFSMIQLMGQEKECDTWGLVYNSVGMLRAKPRHAAELVSQVLLGTPVKILEQQGAWRRIQTPDRYIGWVSGALQPMTPSQHQQYLQLPKVIVTARSAFSFEQADSSALTVSDLVAGDMLEVVAADSGYYRVRYPDGREAFVRKTDVMEVSDWLQGIRLTGESIVQTALQYRGIPYLWGGTSSKGLDCSGFAKQVYWMHGIILARDASQQERCGSLVDENGDFSNALPGDLVFFGTRAADEEGEKVVHVGIYLGHKRFIHASDYVRISSFDPADSLYDAFNANRYLRTKRIIGEENSEGIEELFHNPFYRSSIACQQAI